MPLSAQRSTWTRRKMSCWITRRKYWRWSSRQMNRSSSWRKRPIRTKYRIILDTLKTKFSNSASNTCLLLLRKNTWNRCFCWKSLKGKFNSNLDTYRKWKSREKTTSILWKNVVSMTKEKRKNRKMRRKWKKKPWNRNLKPRPKGKEGLADPSCSALSSRNR